MSDFQICATNPRRDVDPLVRIRLLELQLATLAGAVHILAEAVDRGGDATDVTGQVDQLLRDTRVPHPQPHP